MEALDVGDGAGAVYRMTGPRIALLSFGFLATAVMIIFFVQTREVELNMGKTEQLLRAELVRKKLDEFIIASDLLSRFIQEDITGKDFSRKQVEERLRQYLRAGPSDLIFGVGLWYEPYSFERDRRLFGPYIHRENRRENGRQSGPSKKEQVLTYDWSGEDYNYPRQSWYLKAQEAKGESYFVDPYFDSELVYASNVRVFFDRNGKIHGVISVDLVLAQLQDLVLQASRPNKEMIYITSREGKLLAHPMKDSFFQLKKIEDGVEGQSLMNYRIEDLEPVLPQDSAGWVRSELEQTQLGWKVVVVSSESYVLEKLISLRNTLIGAFIVIWSMIVVLWRVHEIRDRERVENEEKIERGRAQLIQSAKMAALGEMAAGIAHEINNPLTVIVVKAHQLERKLAQIGADNEINLSLQKISATAERIAQIIKGLKTFSRSAEEDPFQAESLERMVRETISLCAERFKNQKIQLIVDPVPPVKIRCRPTQISQVFLNLLSNAFDAVERLPERWVKIQFVSEVQRGFIRIEFADSGPGIPGDIAKRIVQPFFTTKGVGKGTGLGLSISNGIVEDHLGTLTLDEGSVHTKFVVSLPVIGSAPSESLDG
jgi:signal transduction histidine kinase